MRGSLIITFDDVDGFGGDYLDVYVNSVLNKRIYYNSNSLYSCPLNIGDVVTLQYNDIAPTNLLDLSVYRRDYTTDDEGGDNGIKTTLIASSINITGITFTATTLNTSYDFEYRIDNSNVECFNSGTGFNNQCRVQVYDTINNKIFIGGSFTSYNGVTRNRIAKIDLNGEYDSTFIIGSGFNNTVISLDLQSDGKIIVGGDFTSYSGNSLNRIIRLNTDGSIDNTFSIGTGFNNSVFYIKIQPDGKILCVGTFTSYNGTGANRIIRLNSDGSIDGTFVYGTGLSGGASPIGFEVTLQSDNKILVAGSFTSYNGTGANRIIRLNTDGSIDGTFVYGTGFSGQDTQALCVDSNGKILVGGNFTSYNGTSAIDIIRLNSDGSVDNTFQTPSTTNGFIRTIKQLSNGQYMIGGGIDIYDVYTRWGLVKLNSNGSVDTSFDLVKLPFTSGFPYYFDELTDSSIITCGDLQYVTTTTVGFITKCNINGNSLLCP